MSAQTQQIFDVRSYVSQIAQSAYTASRQLASSSTEARNDALKYAARQLERSGVELAKANSRDLEQGRHKGLSAAMLDRLELTPARVQAMLDSLLQTAELPDPVGEITDVISRNSGIRVGRMRVPIGVIGIIYESRPNVTTEASALCVKSGNAVVLRGGSEAFHSNRAIANCLIAGLEQAQVSVDAIKFIETTDRQAINELISMDEYVDVIVPRGGKGLIETISKHATIPVIKHLDGVCHVYVDGHADSKKALDIVMNAKTQRYGVCNAAETLLIARDIAESFLADVMPMLLEKGVEIRGCATTCQFVDEAIPATEQDWYEEYLAPILAVRVVDGVDQAIAHIERYGSAHTDAIVTENFSTADRFLREVDSSSVMVNASTRFADGFEYGLGAEIGISTNKLHARGPVGLEGLTTQKFVVFGDGTIRES